MNIKRRSLEQERTAVHCDYFCVRPMLMLGPQPPSLVSDHGSLPGEEPLCYHYISFHPSSPPIATPGRPPLGHTPGRYIYWREDLPVRSLTWWQRLHFLNPRLCSPLHHVPLTQTPPSSQPSHLWCDIGIFQSLETDPRCLPGTGHHQLPLPTRGSLR